MTVTIKPSLDPMCYSSMIEFTSDSREDILSTYSTLQDLLGPETPLGTKHNDDSWRAIVSPFRLLVLVETPGTAEAMIIMAFPDFIREGHV